MSEIKVGDLAIVVKPMPCCGVDKSIGRVVKIIAIEYAISQCKHCNELLSIALCGLVTSDGGFQVDRLKRIPPLDELDDVKRDEEITA